MVGTRKSLPNSNDELDPSDPKLKSILKKLQIDGTNALKGDRKRGKKPAEAAPKNVYHYRGAVYEVTGTELPEWLASQPSRYKSKSNSTEPEHAQEGTPSVRDSKKRKRETTEPEESLANIPPARLDTSSSSENSVVAADTSLTASDSPAPPPAQRRKLNHVVTETTGEEASPDPLTRESPALTASRHSTPAHTTTTQVQTTQDSPLEDFAARRSPVRDPLVQESASRNTPAQATPIPAASVAESPMRTRSARKGSPSQARASPTPPRSTRATAAGPSIPQERRTSNMNRSKRMSRSMANQEPTRDDAVEAGFKMSPLPISAIMPATVRKLKENLLNISKKNSLIDRKLTEYKLAHLLLKKTNTSPQAKSGAQQAGATNITQAMDVDVDEATPYFSEPIIRDTLTNTRTSLPIPIDTANHIREASSPDTENQPRSSKSMPPPRRSLDRVMLSEKISTLPKTNKNGDSIRWSFDPKHMNNDERAESIMFRGRMADESKSAKRRRVARELKQVRSWERVQEDVI